MRKENAYFSLEACLILPLVFYVILFMIYVGFYQYDRCLLEQDVYRMLIRAQQTRFADNQELMQKMKAEDTHWYYDKYVLCQWAEKTIEVEHGKIRIAQSGALKTGMSAFSIWNGSDSWNFRADFTGNRLCPEQTIRNCRKLEQLAERRK